MEKKVFQLNQDHRGISIAAPIILILLILISYRVFYRVLPLIFGGRSAEYIFIALFASLFGSALILWVADPLLKKMLPSGHALTVDSNAKSLTYAVNEEVQQVLENKPDWQMTKWFFRMGRFVKSGRERQIPNGWYCLAVSLKAEAEELTLFCYAPPRKQRVLANLFNWNEISMFETLDEKRNPNLPIMRPPTLAPSIPSRLLVGDKGHIWLGERKRREDGLEMSPKDFQQLLSYLEGVSG